MNPMRRFIDVIFVEPKNRCYVVLHQGQFWQLPRLNLTANAWLLKKPFEGNLSEIYVSKDQGLACEKLAHTLTTYELPLELHGLDGYRFLDWWSMNDYKWLSTQDVLELDGGSIEAIEPIKTTETVATAKTTETTATLNTQAPPSKQPTHVDDEWQFDDDFNNAINQPSNTPADTPDNTKTKISPAGHKILAQMAQQTTPPTQTMPSQNSQIQHQNTHSQNAQHQSVQSQSVASQTPPKEQSFKTETQSPPKAEPKPKKTSEPTGFDIFDNMLDELTDEVLHSH